MIDLTTNLIRLLFDFMLPAARAAGILFFLPGIGAVKVPTYVRLLIAGSLSLLVAGAIDHHTPIPAGPADLFAILLSELLLGVMVGWTVIIFLESIRWAGEILDMQVGLRMEQFVDPFNAQGSSLLGHFYHLTALTIFFVLNGHHWIIAGIGRSFVHIPIGHVTFGAPVMQLLVDAAACALEIGIRVALAGVVALLLADVALAIIGRAVPQMNVFLVGIPGKIAVGMAIVAFSAPLAADTFALVVAQIEHYVRILLGGA